MITDIAPLVVHESVADWPGRNVGGTAAKETICGGAAGVEPASTHEKTLVGEAVGVRLYVSESWKVPGVVGVNSKSCRSHSPAWRVTGRVTGLPPQPEPAIPFRRFVRRNGGPTDFTSSMVPEELQLSTGEPMRKSN